MIRGHESLEVRLTLDSTVVFNEVMYNPGVDQDLEWIELHNQMAVDMDISRWSIDGAGFTFPAGTVLGAGEYLVVAKSPEKFAAATGSSDAFGPYDGQLSGSGETLRLLNNSGRTMDQLAYEDQQPWPVAADGSGATLAKRDAGSASAPAANWAASLDVGGTPGAVNFGDQAPYADIAARQIVINELTAGGAAAPWVELWNPQPTVMDLHGYVLQWGDGEDAPRHEFASQPVAANGYATLDLQPLGWQVSPGDRLFLYEPGAQCVADAAVVADHLLARAADLGGDWQAPDRPTPGAINSFAFETDIVINEIMYHGPGVASTPDRPPAYETTTIVSIDDNTDWLYRDSAAPLAADWAQEVYSGEAVGWHSGPALIGFESSLLDEPVRTELANPAIQFPHITTYYFQHAFQFDRDLTDPTLEIWLDHFVDDGAVFYLNGVEFHRFQMPDGPIDGDTFAAVSVGNADRVNNVAVPKELLQDGTNYLSVEVHQVDGTSNDVVFGAELRVREQVSPFVPGSPYLPSQEQWIELLNRSQTRTVDLSGWRITDGVSYTFAEGVSLGPGQFLVIATNAAELQATYPERQNILGPLQGELSNRDERLALLDSHGNLADEVHYYDSGRWPSYADGGGSSLELRDPWSDNSRPESWQASDESSRAPWQTISYRGVVERDGFTNGVTSRYHEFILGLLDAGELLIDDVSVIEDPAGEAIQRIQNEDFQQDALGSEPARWRIAGNHHGLVTLDPDDPSNHVLHVRATGALEDRLNHAETTFAERGTIRVGTEYEITLRARWVAGSNQLNTRLYFDRLQQTNPLERPLHAGTPGLANRSLTPNIGPTYTNLHHTPVVPDPEQPVVVSVEAEDPQGVTSMTLWYAVNDGPLQQIAMLSLGSGRYAGEIPGQAASAVVQFFVQGTDGENERSFFPAAGSQSRALYKVQDNRARDGLMHNFRIVMTPADTDFLHERTNVTSNDRLGATVIYNEQEVFYNVGVRLKGSNAGRSDGTYLSFDVAFDPMQRFRGVHDSVAVDRSGRSSGTPLTQDEILIHHIANHAGDIPAMYDDLVYVIAPNPRHSRPALLMMAEYNDEFLDTQYEDGSDGTLFKLDIAYVPNSTVDRDPESPKVPSPYSHPQPTKDLLDYGDDKEAYRAHLLIRNNRAEDDYSRIIAAGKVLSLPASQLDAAVQEVIDVDQWARVFALQSLVGAADVYTRGGLHHNIEFYVRPSDNRVLAFPWDWDFAFTGATSQSLIGTSGAAGRLMSRPTVRRLVYGHLLDIMNTTYNRDYMDRWIDHYGQVAGQNLSTIKSYVAARERYVRARLPDEIPFEITTNDGQPIMVDQPFVVLEGKGWINVRQIRLAGQVDPLPVTWLDDDSWQARVPLGEGDSVVALEAVDHRGTLVGTTQIIVNSSVANPVLESLRVTEINYHPADPTSAELSAGGALESSDFEFLEFQNIGNLPINLLGTHFDEGIEFAFADVTLQPGDVGVVVRNATAFSLRYGADVRVLGQFTAGRLDNAGETLRIMTGLGETLVDFAYDDQAPWPTAADGEHATLELIDAVNTPTTEYGNAASWRASYQSGGSPGLPTSVGPGGDGDLNHDGEVTSADIDLLCQAIQAGDMLYDLDQDQQVDRHDLYFFVQTIIGSAIGDANLDGVFDSSDFVTVFQRGEYEDSIGGNSTWADGDWNCDGEFTTSDLVVAFQYGGYVADAREVDRVHGLRRAID